MNSNSTLQAKRPGLRKHINLESKRETAQYISELTLELRNLAKAHNMLSLQGLLEVAYYEAFTAATHNELPEGEREHLEELLRAANG